MHVAARAVAILLLVCALAAAEESDGTVAVCCTALPAISAFSLCLPVSAAVVCCVRCVCLLMLRRLVRRLLS